MRFILFFLIPSVAYSITNIEAQRRPGLPEQGLGGSLAVAAEGQHGNVREEDYLFNARLQYRQQDNIYLGIAQRAYGSTRGLADTDSSFAHARWTHLFTQTWASEVFSQWEEDRFDNLTSRSLIGGGARRVLLDKEAELNLALGLGAFYEREELDLSDFSEVNYTVRINSYLTYQHQLNDNVSINSTVYYQPSLDDLDDTLGLLTFGLNVKLTDALSLDVSYQANYDSQPAENLDVDPVIESERLNGQYRTGLVYQF